MAEYVIKLADAYCMTDMPLVLRLGYKHTKPSGYKCITQVDANNILIKTDNNQIYVDDNSVMVSEQGSYYVTVYDTVAAEPQPIPFSFYAYNNVFTINHDNLLNVFNKELPDIYNPQQKINYADNFATTGLFAKIYDYIYTQFNNTLFSLGAEKGYNREWEVSYVGVKNFIVNAKYPAPLLQTLMHLCTQTGTRVKDIATCISRAIFQYTGVKTPIIFEYNETLKRWQLSVFATDYTTWILGVEGNSELGITTFLGNQNTISFLWFIYNLAEHIIPAFIKFELVFRSREYFELNYDVLQAGPHDYADPEVNYGAYEVVNNNSSFNTRGYFKK